MKHTVYVGNVLDILKKLPDESVDCIITSPPYWGLRDYGEEVNTIWDGDPNCEHEWEYGVRKGQSGGKNNPYAEKLKIKGKENFREFPDTKYAFCKKCGAWYGQLGLEPTLDLYLKHMLQITAELKRVLKKTGVMFWNMGDNYREKCLAMQNYRLVLRMIDEQGWILRNVIIWHKPNAMPSSVKDRFSNKYEPVFMLVRSKKYWFDLDAVRVPHKRPELNGKRGRIGNVVGGNELQSGFANKKGGWADYWKGIREYNPLGKNPGDVWGIPTQPFSARKLGITDVDHFATFPMRLVEPMIKAGCPQWICKKCGKARVRMTKTEHFNKKIISSTAERDKGSSRNWAGERFEAKHYTIGFTDCGCNAGWDAGVVLDPFAGSGTTMIVAEKLGRNSIGIEINPKYVEIIKARFKHEFPDGNYDLEVKEE